MAASNQKPIIILVVDDDKTIRTAFGRHLLEQGYEVLTASSGEEALGIVQRQKVSATLLDVRLPGISGLDLIPQLLDAEPTLAILIMTAASDSAGAATAIQRGAIDYLTKPVDLDHLIRVVQRALQVRNAMFDDRRPVLKDEVVRRSAELRMQRESLERLSVATLESLVTVLEAKDRYLRDHSARVADIAATVASELGVSDEEVEVVRTAGRLHDIGMVGIREEVWNKQGPLTDDEYEHVKQHVLVGSQILAPLVHLATVNTYVRSHHERFDGQGYPDHLSGEAIPLGGRILAAAEIYDALTTPRPYQERMEPEFAIERLRDLSGTVLDPKVFLAFEAVVGRRRALPFLDDGGG